MVLGVPELSKNIRRTRFPSSERHPNQLHPRDFAKTEMPSMPHVSSRSLLTSLSLRSPTGTHLEVEWDPALGEIERGGLSLPDFRLSEGPMVRLVMKLPVERMVWEGAISDSSQEKLGTLCQGLEKSINQ